MEFSQPGSVTKWCVPVNWESSFTLVTSISHLIWTPGLEFRKLMVGGCATWITFFGDTSVLLLKKTLESWFENVPHEDPDPGLGHSGRPVRSSRLASSLRSQCRLAQDHIWTFWFALVSYITHIFCRRRKVSLFCPKARVLFTCITISTSFVPAAMLNLVFIICFMNYIKCYFN